MILRRTSIPLQLHGIEGRYATALYSAAVRKNKLDQVASDISSIKPTLTTPKIAAFLNTPTSKDLKVKTVRAMLEKTKVDEITRNFFELLAENSRMDQTTKIVSSFEQLVDASKGVVNVYVTSAKELDPKTLKQLSGTLQKSPLIDKTASKVNVVNKVDPQILGGLVIEANDRTIDLSIASKVNKLNRLLDQAV